MKTPVSMPAFFTSKKNLSGYLFKLGILLAFLACFQWNAAQSTLDRLDLIRNSGFSRQARILSEQAAIGSYAFHTKIGGISFEAVARPVIGLWDIPVAVDYREGKLAVFVGDSCFYPELPGWQLAPIANYADSPCQAVFTIFGEHFGDGGAMLRYHPAFLDNLLGLRLFQADILLPAPDDETLLEGILPDEEQMLQSLSAQLDALKEAGYSEQDFYDMSNSLYRLLTGGQELPRKDYMHCLAGKSAEELREVMRAYSAQPAVEPVNLWKVPEENGTPVWGAGEKPYAAGDTHRLKETGKKLAVESARMQLAMNKKIQEEFNSLSVEEQQQKAAGLLRLLSGDATFYRSYILTDWGKEVTFRVEDGRFVLNGTPWYLFSEIDDETASVRHSVEESRLYEANWPLLKAYNPAVITAVENTMRWAAFFRYVKQRDPHGWACFLQRVNERSADATEVHTPVFFR